KLNPYGKVPVLDDNGQVIFESCIINEYLEDQYPAHPLMPREPYQRARGRVLGGDALNGLHEAYWALRTEMHRQPHLRNEDAIAGARQDLRDRSRYLE